MRGTRVLHFSTDYVFDGEADRPYRENDSVNPQTVYGRTKAEGEALLLEASPTSIVLRTAWLYGLYGPNFVSTMLRLMKEKDSLGVVDDQFGAPTWTADLARVIVFVLENPPVRGGLYHASGEGQTTWHGFAAAIAEEARSVGLLGPHQPLEIRPLSTAEYPTKAKRPRWSVLSKTRLQEELGLSFPPWHESLHNYLQILSKNPS
jgi:dTDP-4-dehydrorhamnose reductase